MEDDRETVRLWRVNKTIHELVRDRGYQVADDEINIDLETFKAEYAPTGGSVDRTKLNFFTEHSSHENQRLFVFYSMERNVGVKTMRQFISIMEERDIQRGIIIWPDKMTSAARKVIDAMRGTFHLEDFEEAYLLVNITHHHLVPRHDPLYPEEKKELLQRYRLKETQLPRIQQADPVAKYFGLQRGQVVKITRPSETSGRYCSYRICISIILAGESFSMASAAASSNAGSHYPPAVSSYYFGPPPSSAAFGQGVTGNPALHVPKEIVRIERDYSSGELPQFHPSFPLEIEGRISPTTFSELVNDLNALLIEAHNPRRVWIDNTLAIATLYLSTLVHTSHYKKTLAKVDELVARTNAQVLEKAGLRMVHPAKTAFLFIEIEYF